MEGVVYGYRSSDELINLVNALSAEGFRIVTVLGGDDRVIVAQRETAPSPIMVELDEETIQKLKDHSKVASRMPLLRAER